MKAKTRKSSSAQPRRVMGMMSGTSADGVDAACVEIQGQGLAMRAKFLWHHYRTYPASLRRRLQAIMAPAETRTELLAQLHSDLGRFFAQSADEAIDAAPRHQRPKWIGLAGQTVCHLPGSRRQPTATLQLGEPAWVAEKTGLPTIAGFRQSDVAAGGQGAPLVPWTDWVLLRDFHVNRAVQNIGGIANVTWLPARGELEQVIAFDTGPGNMIIDALAEHFSQGKLKMDRHGRLASKGGVHQELVTRWKRHPFLAKKPPKTTGREVFGRVFVEKALEDCHRRMLSKADALATATAFTAQTIAQAYQRFLDCDRQSVTEIIVCGGGAYNSALMRMLAEELPECRVETIDKFAIPIQAKEAMSFALLAAAWIDNVPANLPQATGASREVVMGCCCEKR